MHYCDPGPRGPLRSSSRIRLGAAGGGILVDEMQIPCAVVLTGRQLRGDWSGFCGTRRLGADDPGDRSAPPRRLRHQDLAARSSSGGRGGRGEARRPGLEEPTRRPQRRQHHPGHAAGDAEWSLQLQRRTQGLSSYAVDDEPDHAWHLLELLATAFAYEADPSIPGPTSSIEDVHGPLGSSSSNSGRSVQGGSVPGGRIFRSGRSRHLTSFLMADDREHPGAASSREQVRDQREHVRTTLPSQASGAGGGLALIPTLLPELSYDTDSRRVPRSWTWAAAGPSPHGPDDLAPVR